jgi:hypothetical protein
MRLSRMLLVTSLSLLLAGVGCDSDNNRAADGNGLLGAGEATCPCFTQDDILSTGSGAQDITCVNLAFGLVLAFSPTPPGGLDAPGVVCQKDGTGCFCATNSHSENVTLGEYLECMRLMLTGLINFNADDTKISGCEVAPP